VSMRVCVCVCVCVGGGDLYAILITKVLTIVTQTTHLVLYVFMTWCLVKYRIRLHDVVRSEIQNTSSWRGT